MLVWNQIAGGNDQYVAGLVAFNSIFQIPVLISLIGVALWLKRRWFDEPKSAVAQDKDYV